MSKTITEIKYERLNKYLLENFDFDESGSLKLPRGFFTKQEQEHEVYWLQYKESYEDALNQVPVSHDSVMLSEMLARHHFESFVNSSYERIIPSSSRLIYLKTDDILTELKENPDEIKLISPRKFEYLIGDILKNQGWQVEITPQTRDGGKDIIATTMISGMKILLAVECKRWREDRPVDIDTVRSFMYTVRDDLRANKGMIATTSYFSKEVQNMAQKWDWLLSLRDFEAIKEMLNSFGKYKQQKNSGIWLSE